MFKPTLFTPAMKAIAAGVCAASLGGCFQVQTYGPVAGADVTVTPLREQDNILYQGKTWDPEYLIGAVGQERWDGYNSLYRLFLLGVVIVNVDNVDPQGLYLVTVAGGYDTDYDGNLSEDSSYTPVAGPMHAVMTGEQLVSRGPIISAATEIGYQWIRYSYEYMDDGSVVSDLDYIAGEYLDDVNDDGTVDMNDMLAYNRMNAPGKYRWDMAKMNNLTTLIASGATEYEIESAAYDAIDSGSHHGGGDDEANNHIETAEYIGSMSAGDTLSILYTVSEDDFRDYLKFTADGDFHAEVTLYSLEGASLDLALYIGEEYVTGSNLADDDGLVAHWDVNAGEDLVVEVFNYSGAGQYELQVEAKPR